MKKTLLILTAALALLMALIPIPVAKAGAPLDEIEVYRITVDMESDASMDLTYHIEWKVLDDSSEGPLSWVKIGVPNQYVDNIQALSDSIADIYYYDDGGSYIRIDLDRDYYEGEIVTMDFSLRVMYMYMASTDSNVCSYYFTPGWFDGIEVKSLTILWNSDNVKYSDSASKEGDYLVWTASLQPGETFSTYVEYDISAFNTDYAGPPEISKEPYEETTYYPDYEYESDYNSGDIGGLIALIIIAPIVIIIIVIRKIGGGGNGGYRGGFGGYYHGGGGCASSCACACGCACACACAGGGRAGCSAKNFYGTVIRTDKLKETLEKKDNK